MLNRVKDKFWYFYWYIHLWLQDFTNPAPKARRTAGHRGRHPARRLRLKSIHEYAQLAAPQYPIDVTEGVSEWGMLGNGPDDTCTIRPDGVGDCTFAARQHYKMVKAARAKLTETWETSNELVTEYLTYNHGVDQGANIADLLLDCFNAGKILAFAPVDHTDPAKVDAAMTAFTGVYCGVTLTDDADDLFSAGQPWTVADGQQPDLNDGHCILKVSADGKTDGWITWGADQKSTTDWTKACLEEAWVIITEEDVQDHSIDIAALRSDILALGGKAKAA